MPFSMYLRLPGLPFFSFGRRSWNVTLGESHRAVHEKCSIWNVPHLISQTHTKHTQKSLIAYRKLQCQAWTFFPTILILTSMENFCYCMGIVKHASPHLQSEIVQLNNSYTNMVLSHRMKRILYIEVMRQMVCCRLHEACKNSPLCMPLTSKRFPLKIQRNQQRRV